MLKYPGIGTEKAFSVAGGEFYWEAKKIVSEE